MRRLPISNVPLVEEETAIGEVAETYNKIKSFLGTPSVSIAHMAAANSPAVLAIAADIFINFMEQTVLPHPLLFMIHYTISHAKQCACCLANYKQACQSVGIDDATLGALIDDLDSVAPQRTQDIIRFAVKCAMEPLTLTGEDYDNLRNEGITDQELVEITFWAGYAMLNDTWADALKLDDPTRQQFSEA